MPWCFNNEGREGQPRWEYCNVPKCSDKGFYWLISNYSKTHSNIFIIQNSKIDHLIFALSSANFILFLSNILK